MAAQRNKLCNCRGAGSQREACKKVRQVSSWLIVRIVHAHALLDMRGRDGVALYCASERVNVHVHAYIMQVSVRMSTQANAP